MTLPRSATAAGNDTENPAIKIVRRTKVDPRDESLFEHVQLVASREAWESCEERKETWDVLDFGDLIVASRIVFCVAAV